MPLRKRPTTKQRQRITEQAMGCCEYCKTPLAFATVENFDIEHITPVAKGGLTVLENPALSCPGCNDSKQVQTHAIDPESGESVALFHPRQQLWIDHFVWGLDGQQLQGRTSVGRATILALRLNRSGLVNLRRAQWALNLHPLQASFVP
jgi:hypothetical protein